MNIHVLLDVLPRKVSLQNCHTVLSDDMSDVSPPLQPISSLTQCNSDTIVMFVKQLLFYGKIRS